MATYNASTTDTVHAHRPDGPSEAVGPGEPYPDWADTSTFDPELVRRTKPRAKEQTSGE